MQQSAGDLLLTIPPRRPARKAEASTQRTHGLARVLSKRGLCSRSQAETLVRDGRVRVDGKLIRDPESRTHPAARIAIDDTAAGEVARRYLMLNKPRGLVTTANDERGRETVYALFADAGLPWIAPVGRLDKASEGLLLFSNDSEWAAAISAPESQLDKTYHVQIDRLPDPDLLARIQVGVRDGGELLAAKSATELRRGEKNAWLEIVLDEGRNRQIRRLLAALDVSVLRLVRVAIGSLRLGALGKGEWRVLDEDEVRALARPTEQVRR
ncbi:23S rRNA pseudouridine2605 synthase [Dokdonella immobilis]|uniref:Pseudouridine synthase n=1 Tax=Dokdonella immobilis TaxID=578942 RepID=A0A1I4Z2A9_9GAMM|nr:23S rRNA pseudouridine2605 synthase [Dokdonella immobilis]